MARLDTQRSHSLLSPRSFNPRRVDIVGGGALGSHTAPAVAELGVEDIHVHDFDTVAGHNIGNQAYRITKDIGRPKLEALAEIVGEKTGITVHTHHGEQDGSGDPFDQSCVVFMCVDSMSARKALWDGAIKLRPNIRCYIESRMGAMSGRVYMVNPCNPIHIKAYEKTLCTDEKVGISACGAKDSLGSTARIVAGTAVNQLIRWFAVEEGRMEERALVNEIIFSYGLGGEIVFLSRRFK